MTESLREKIAEALYLEDPLLGSGGEVVPWSELREFSAPTTLAWNRKAADSILALLADSTPPSDAELREAWNEWLLSCRIVGADHAANLRRVAYNLGFARGRASVEAELQALREKLANAEAQLERSRQDAMKVVRSNEEYADLRDKLYTDIDRLKAHQFRAAAQFVRDYAQTHTYREVPELTHTELRRVADWLESQAPKAEQDAEAEARRRLVERLMAAVIGDGYREFLFRSWMNVSHGVAPTYSVEINGTGIGGGYAHGRPSSVAAINAALDAAEFERLRDRLARWLQWRDEKAERSEKP